MKRLNLNVNVPLSPPSAYGSPSLSCYFLLFQIPISGYLDDTLGTANFNGRTRSCERVLMFVEPTQIGNKDTNASVQPVHMDKAAFTCPSLSLFPLHILRITSCNFLLATVCSVIMHPRGILTRASSLFPQLPSLLGGFKALKTFFEALFLVPRVTLRLWLLVPYLHNILLIKALALCC